MNSQLHITRLFLKTNGCYITHNNTVASLNFNGTIHVRLTAVFLVAPIRTVTEAVTSESPDDAVDAIGAGEECRGTF